VFVLSVFCDCFSPVKPDIKERLIWTKFFCYLEKIDSGTYEMLEKACVMNP